MPQPLIRSLLILPLILLLSSAGPRYEQAVVNLTGNEMQCSAVPIAPLTFMTASHCVANQTDFTMFVDNWLRVRTVEVNAEADIAVLVGTSDKGYQPVKLGKEPKPGDQVFIVGFGMGAPRPFVIDAVFMTEMKPPEGGEQTFGFLSRTGTIGMSGGPVLDKSMKLVGIEQGGYDFPHLTIGYVAAYPAVKALYDKHHK